jgi:cardiolipin synthase
MVGAPIVAVLKMEKSGPNIWDQGEFQRYLTAGNRVTAYTDGDAMFGAIWDAIDGARKKVWLEIYIYGMDAVGKRTLEALTAASKRNCDVVLLYDRFGSLRLKESFLEPLTRSGASVVPYNPISLWGRLGSRIGSAVHRDHRKMLLVDDDIGFCGGFNISADYAGKELGKGRFYDIMLRLQGPCVRPLSELFAAALKTGGGLERTPSNIRGPFSGGAPVHVLGLNARRERKALDRFVDRLVGSARRRCYIITPYFVPPLWFQKAMIRAAGNGADVRLLTAGPSDIPTARLAGRHIYGRMIENGIRIYELTDPLLHAKSITVDSIYSLIGSYNFERVASRYALEVDVGVVDPNIANFFETEFYRNLENSHEIILKEWNLRSLPEKILQWFVYHMMWR